MGREQGAMDQSVYGGKPLKIDRMGNPPSVPSLILASIVVVYFLVTSLAMPRRGPADTTLAVGCVALAVLSLYVVGLGWYVRALRVAIWPDRVDATNGFGQTRSLLRTNIKGYWRNRRAGRIFLVPSDGLTKPIGVSAELLDDPLTRTWFEGLPDLNAQDIKAARKQLETDPRLGATDDERQASFAQMSLVARIVNTPGLVFGSWAMFTGYPFNIPVLGAIAVVLCALAAKFYFGSFLSLDTVRADPRPSVWLTFLFCTVTVGMRGLIDNGVLDWTIALECAGAVGLGVSFLLIARNEDLRTNSMQTCFIVLMLIGFSYGAIVTVNRSFDFTQPEIFRVRVEKSRDGKRIAYSIALDQRAGNLAGTEIQVSRALYNSVRPSEIACVSVSKGALGFRYYVASRCGS
jgi:hypothetical protein